MSHPALLDFAPEKAPFLPAPVGVVPVICRHFSSPGGKIRVNKFPTGLHFKRQK
jgi:hypothetical protein